MAAGSPRGASLRDWVALFGAVLGAFMAILDIQITNSSLKDIQGSLAASLDEGSWISTGYLIAEIIVIPLTGWLAQVFSLRRYLAVSAGLFVVFSILCGLSTTLTEMILFRVGQGLSGGALIPAAFTIVSIKLPPHQRPIGLVLFTVTATFAPAFGPTIGGWLTDTYSWHAIFYINIIPGLAMIAMLLYGLERQQAQLGRLITGDWFGIITMAVGLGALEIVLEEGARKDWFGSPLITDCAIVAGIGLALAIATELVRKEPFIDLRLLAQPARLACYLCGLALGVGLYGSIYLLPVYLGQIQGYNALQIGQVLLWMGVPQFFVLPFVPMLMQRIDHRLLVGVGFILFATSSFMNAYMSADTSGEQLRWSMLVRAFGQPLLFPPLSAAAAAGLAPAKIPNSSSLFNMMRNLGGSVGIAVLATFTITREHFHFSTIAERITQNGTLLQERLAGMAGQFAANGHGGDGAPMQAVASLAEQVRRQSFVMAYCDCFFVIGVVLLLSLIPVMFLAKPEPASFGGH
ncbi:MAG: DHA2 family efflux MFS transporter permease subunit [Aliidongia sp.]